MASKVQFTKPRGTAGVKGLIGENGNTGQSVSDDALSTIYHRLCDRVGQVAAIDVPKALSKLSVKYRSGALHGVLDKKGFVHEGGVFASDVQTFLSEMRELLTFDLVRG